MIFAIETSAAVASLALVQSGSVLVELWTSGKVKHSEAIFALAARLLDRYDPDRRLVKGIAISIGPGMFTALRVGLSLAKGTALSLSIPVTAVNTLDALAASVRSDARFLAPIVNAGRGDVYLALYEGRRSTPLRVSPYRLVKAEHVGRLIKRETLVFGPALEAVKGAVPGGGSRIVLAATAQPAPPASVIGRLGEERLKAGEIAGLGTLEPFYIKEPDAITRGNRPTQRR